MPAKVKDTPFEQPDVSKIDPIHVPMNHTASYPVKLIYIDEYQQYRHCIAYWDAIDKCWRYQSSGLQIDYAEAVRTEPIDETKQHY